MADGHENEREERLAMRRLSTGFAHQCLIWTALAQIALLPTHAQAVVAWNDWTAGNEIQFVRQQEGYLYVGTPGGLVMWDLSQRWYDKHDARDGTDNNGVVPSSRPSDVHNRTPPRPIAPDSPLKISVSPTVTNSL